MSTRMRDLLEQAAGTPDVPVDVDAAVRRGDQLRRRRQLAAGALAGVVMVGTAGLAMQLPGGVAIPEVAGQNDNEPSDPHDETDPLPDPDSNDDPDPHPDPGPQDDGALLPDPDLQPEELREEIATGHLADGRPWTARALHEPDFLCAWFSIADVELVATCSGNSDRDHGAFAAPLGDRPGGADITVGLVGGDWHAPVQIELQDGTTTEAELHKIEGSTTRFYLAEHTDAVPTHLVARDETGDTRRMALYDERLSSRLNDDLVELIERAGFKPAGGDHDYLSGSNSVDFAEGGVAIFLLSQDRADLGDVTFDQRFEEQVGEVSLRVGQRSDGIPAAEFDCGDHRFTFHGDPKDRVHEVASGIAEVASCPYATSPPE